MVVGRIYRPTERLKKHLCKYYSLNPDDDYVVCLIRYLSTIQKCTITVSCCNGRRVKRYDTTIPKVGIYFFAWKFMVCSPKDLIPTSYQLADSALSELMDDYKGWKEYHLKHTSKVSKRKSRKQQSFGDSPQDRQTRKKNSKPQRPNKEHPYIPPIPYSKPTFWVYSNHWQGGAPQ